jgi:hypothetical protein
VILVITPTLDRPHKMRAVAENIKAATRSRSHNVFVLEDTDAESIAMATQLAKEDLSGWCVNKRKRNFTGALNTGYQVAVHGGTRFTHVFNGSDDVVFADGWDLPALAVFAANPALRVVGTNDLHNGAVLSGQSATSYLVDRRYIDEMGGVADQPPGVMQCEEYDHNYTDTEFIDTAKARGLFAPCLESVVEHCHPAWGLAEWDAGYVKSVRGMQADGVLFTSRRHLWVL